MPGCGYAFGVLCEAENKAIRNLRSLLVILATQSSFAGGFYDLCSAWSHYVLKNYSGGSNPIDAVDHAMDVHIYGISAFLF